MMSTVAHTSAPEASKWPMRLPGAEGSELGGTSLAEVAEVNVGKMGASRRQLDLRGGG